MKKKYVKVNLILEKEQKKNLRVWAKSFEKSMSEFVRDMLKNYEADLEHAQEHMQKKIEEYETGNNII